MHKLRPSHVLVYTCMIFMLCCMQICEKPTTQLIFFLFQGHVTFSFVMCTNYRINFLPISFSVICNTFFCKLYINPLKIQWTHKRQRCLIYMYYVLKYNSLCPLHAILYFYCNRVEFKRKESSSVKVVFAWIKVSRIWFWTKLLINKNPHQNSHQSVLLLIPYCWQLLSSSQKQGTNKMKFFPQFCEKRFAQKKKKATYNQKTTFEVLLLAQLMANLGRFIL